eukprot:1191613-Prorocentrum_minimum.AAC.12
MRVCPSQGARDDNLAGLQLCGADVRTGHLPHWGAFHRAGDIPAGRKRVSDANGVFSFGLCRMPTAAFGTAATVSGCCAHPPGVTLAGLGSWEPGAAVCTWRTS